MEAQSSAGRQELTPFRDRPAGPSSAAQGERPKQHLLALGTALYLLVISASLYLQVFILPRTPILASGDQAIFLADATRMLRGQAIYRDFFQFTPPGTVVLYSALFRAFGIRAWIPEAMLVMIGAGLAWLTLVVSRRIFKGPAAFLPGLLFITLAFHNTLDATHHWYSILALMAALALAITSRAPGRLALVGALCGLATWFTQSHGPAGVLGFALFVWWERRRMPGGKRGLWSAEACLLGSFGAAVLVLNASFMLRAGLHQFFFCTVVFVVKFFSALPFSTWRVYMTELPPLHGWLDLPRWGAFLIIHGVTPLAYLLFLVRYRRLAAQNPGEPWHELMLVSIFGLFLFGSVAPAPGYLRVCSVSLPALVILIWLLSQSGKLERALLISFWVSAGVLLIAEPASRQRHRGAMLDLPTGPTAFLDADVYDEYRWVAQRTQPGETAFGDPTACFALELRNPTEIDFVTANDYTRPAQVDNVVRTLDRERVRYLFWCPVAELPAGPDDHLSPLREYISDHYHLVRAFDGCREIWERNR
jgi:hypothetical protein